MRLAIVGVLGLASAVAHAQPGPDRLQPPGMTDALPPPPPDTGRSSERGMLGIGGAVFAQAAYVFRFWKDDRKRVKVVAQQHFGGWFAADPGNEVGMNAGMMGVGLGYEAPL